MTDRRREYEQRKKESGYMRVGIWIPKQERALIRELREFLDEAPPERIEELKDFFRSDYEFWLTDPEITPTERAFAEKRLRELAAAPAASSASEEERPVASASPVPH